MGSNFIRHILQEHNDGEVINFDKLTYAGNLENLRDVEQDPRYTFVQGDIADSKAVSAVVSQGVEAIINFAAETHVDRSIMDPMAFLRTDVFGTYTLLEAVRTYKIPKMIQISTDEVFGSVDEGFFDEESPFRPNSPYSASKAGGDHLCRAYYETYGTPVVVTHSCNFYGPYQYPEKIIPLFVTNLLEGKKVPLYGDGQNVREWIFTEDYCRAIACLLEKAEGGSVYNIGTGNERTNLDLTKQILAAVGVSEDMIEPVKDRAGHDRRYAVESSRLRALGWEPRVSFDEGLERTVAWYRENRAWWERLKSGDYMEYYKKQYFDREYARV